MTAYVVDTTGGKVRGVEIDEGVLALHGIPYATPPMGPSRLRPPRRAEPWSGAPDAGESRS
ncbi:carboxylesterase family protein [Streptomyces mirabilis]|uniref:carboxylesterase family protein n=1 Tax=Streptomyces mirabilis TaxID=68239 RepID=UPI00365E05E2